MIRTVTATEYITPLREGGSLPAIMRADDGQIYVMKFTGAGQGKKALIAELLGGEIARILGLKVPEIVFIRLDPEVGRSEGDPEIQDLLKASAGLNLAMTFLPHSLSFTTLNGHDVSEEFASRLTWLDAFITNVDRTPRNVNLLLHNGEIWLIDHGASLYFHHNWQDPIKQSETAFPQIKDHVLLPMAAAISKADAHAKTLLTGPALQEIVAQIPEAWIEAQAPLTNSEQQRAGYLAFLRHRLAKSHLFVEEANRARAQLI